MSDASGNNVVSLHGEQPQGLKRQDPATVKELKMLLEMAEAGELVGLAWAGAYFDGTSCNHYAGWVTRGMVGSLFSVLARANEQLDRDNEPKA